MFPILAPTNDYYGFFITPLGRDNAAQSTDSRLWISPVSVERSAAFCASCGIICSFYILYKKFAEKLPSLFFAL